MGVSHPDDAAMVVSADLTTSPGLADAWRKYLGALDETRLAIEGCQQFRATPEARAKAYHILFEAQAMAYNFAIAPRSGHPRIFHNTAWQTDIYSLGGNGPDFHYATLFLDGRQNYRLWGNVNDSRLLLAQLNSALPGSPGARLIANYDFSSFHIGADGSFEIALSAEPKPGNWIALDPDFRHQWMFFRPSTHGWDDKPADLLVERIGPADDHQQLEDEFDEAAMARRITAATLYLRYVVEAFCITFGADVWRLTGGPNVMKSITQDIAGEVGSPTAEYVNGFFEVEDDEALIVELAARPDGPYWNFQLFDVWLRSLDFVTRQSTLHGDQISSDGDGITRVVISKRDPGIANWLDTSGHRRGQIVLRRYRSRRSGNPVIHRVRFEALAERLPLDTPRTTAGERATELERRRRAYLRRHGE